MIRFFLLRLKDPNSNLSIIHIRQTERLINANDEHLFMFTNHSVQEFAGDQVPLRVQIALHYTSNYTAQYCFIWMRTVCSST